MRRPVVAGLVLAALAWATPASAHASLESSDPASASTLATSPGTVTLTFTEPPDPDLTTVEVLDVGGAPVPVGAPTLQGSRTVRLPIDGTLAEGSYTVSWRVVSTVDGHLTSGRFVFGVGVAPAPDAEAAAAAEIAGPAAGGVAAKSLLYAGLFLLVAVAAIGLGAFGGRPRPIHVVAMIGAVLALAGAIGLLLTERQAIGVPLGELLASSTGRPLRWLVVAVLVAGVCAVLGAAKDAWRPALWGSGAAAAAAMWVRASGGHAAAADPPLPQELLQTAHMVAAGLWIGGLVLLWLLLREAAAADDPVGGPPVREVGRFSNVAIVAVGVVVVSGIARSFSELGGFGAAADLLDSTYGRTLVAKVLGALVLIALGAVNRRRSIPRLAADPRPLRRVAGVELVIALGVIVLTATLTSAAPDPETTPIAAPSRVTAEGTDFATTTSVALTLAPGAPGPSTVEVTVTDPDTGDPLSVDDVALRVRSVTRPDVPPESIVLAAQGDAWMATTSAFSLAGTWAATAVVTTGAEAVQVPLVIVTRIPDTTTSVVVGSGVPAVTTTTFAGGTSIQTYVDPAVAGTNQIHVTAFTPEGTEAALDDTTIVAIPARGEPRRLEVTDFGPGHVVANVDLDAGDWSFDVVATTGDDVLQTTFDETIEAA